jgi:parallel beta-helix repeat protein
MLVRRAGAFGLATAFAILALAAGASARTIHVQPGQSIQAAVDQARAGDTVLVAPGTYTEPGRSCPAEPENTCAVAITKDGISLVGQGDVVLGAAGDQDVGIGVGKSGSASCLSDASQRVNGSLIRGLAVRDFGDDGVLLFCVDNWHVQDVSAVGNLEYGIFPSHSGPGRVDHSLATGANDTGIYIGQSHGVRIDHDTATGNVSGFEIENSTGVRADHNLATGNTGGILSFTLPHLDVKVNSDNQIDHNVVRDNNKPNTCLEPSDEVCAVPVGTGILVLAADRNEVTQNDITGNNSFGIGVANYCVATGNCANLDIDPDPDGNHITSNTVTGNGGSPDPNLPSIFAVDLAWDTMGDGNCWSNNVYGTSFPATLPSC